MAVGAVAGVGVGPGSAEGGCHVGGGVFELGQSTRILFRDVCAEHLRFQGKLRMKMGLGRVLQTLVHHRR